MSAIPMFDILHHDLNEFEDVSALQQIPLSPAPNPMPHVISNDLSNSNVSFSDVPAVSPQASVAHQQTGWDDVQRLFGLHGNGQTVAVIDSGIAWDHVALGGGLGPGYRVVGGWDFAESDANPYDDRPAGFHGTHVAGIIGADDPTRSGVASGVDLVALRVFDDAGKGQLAWVENALRWVHQNKNTFENPITTVNLSLGSTWNSTTVPNWATLEDEFRDLRNDGIVVVASAGNSFKQYNAPGLSYPAASPLVIPVASVDADGSLSDFSQRSDRVIAAPGRSILSTVPDHFLGVDGIIDDFAVASGTSMAAPYVAGASVLVRQAMELAGWSSITPSGIYDWLMNTSDSVFDSLTNSTYDRLNLERAIGNLIPTDQVGDDLNSAANVTLQSQFTTDGWNNTLGDRDVYRFTATSNGTVTLNSQSSWLDSPSWTLWVNGQSSPLGVSAEKIFSVVAGQSYAVGIGDADQIGPYQLQWQFNSTGSTPPGGEGNGGASADAAQYGIVRSGTDLQISGTSNTDRYQIDLSQGVRIQVDGKFFNFAPGLIAGVNIDLNGGDDRLEIIGSSASEKVNLSAAGGTIENASVRVSIVDVEFVKFTGGGGYDQAFILGSEGDDMLTASPRSCELTGVGYQIQMNDVERIYVDATQGGQDTASFNDSTGNDRLSVRPQFTSMTGDGFFNYAEGIERVYAYSTAGGIDAATLYDSHASDTFNTSGDIASIVGPNFFSYTRFFEVVEAVSSAGGRDVASVYATQSDSIVVGSDFSGYQDSQWSRIARGFSDSRTYVNNQIVNVRGLFVESLSSVEFVNGFSVNNFPVSGINGEPQDTHPQSETHNVQIASEYATPGAIESNRVSFVDVGIAFLDHDSIVQSSRLISEAVPTNGEFVRLPSESSDHEYESLLVDLEDERRWLDAIFAAHGSEDR